MPHTSLSSVSRDCTWSRRPSLAREPHALDAARGGLHAMTRATQLLFEDLAGLSIVVDHENARHKPIDPLTTLSQSSGSFKFIRTRASNTSITETVTVLFL